MEGDRMERTITPFAGRVTGDDAVEYALSLLERNLGDRVKSDPAKFGVLKRRVADAPSDGDRFPFVYTLSNPDRLWGTLEMRVKAVDGDSGIVMTDTALRYSFGKPDLPESSVSCNRFLFGCLYAHVDPSVPDFAEDFYDDCIRGPLNVYLSTCHVDNPISYEGFLDSVRRGGGWGDRKRSAWWSRGKAFVMESASAVVETARRSGFTYIDRAWPTGDTVLLMFSHGVVAKVKALGEGTETSHVRVSVGDSDDGLPTDIVNFNRYRWSHQESTGAHPLSLYDRVVNGVSEGFAVLAQNIDI